MRSKRRRRSPLPLLLPALALARGRHSCSNSTPSQPLNEQKQSTHTSQHLNKHYSNPTTHYTHTQSGTRGHAWCKRAAAARPRSNLLSRDEPAHSVLLSVCVAVVCV